jgi:hypothetical protein
MRLVLKFVAVSCWPLGQPDYRTPVRIPPRLRKTVYRCARLGSEFFPGLNPMP